jgi:hypothetical protein
MSELERELRTLGREVAFPAEPDLVDGVRAALARPGRREARRPARRPLAVALAVLAVALAAALAVPPARSALARLLRIGGAEIERVETLPETTPNARLAPGRPLELAEARRRAGFRIRTPSACGHCDTVLYDATIPGGRVTIVWPDERPRLFLMQFRGHAVPFVEKLATPRTGVRAVTVDGVLGYWIAGSPHAVVFRDARGRTLFGRRLARNVLLWERGGVTYRLEGDVALSRALSVSDGLR